MAKAERISREQFRDEVLSALRAAGLAGEITYEESADRLVHAERGALDLREHYDALGASPAERRADALEMIAQHFADPPELPEDWDYARPRILAALKTRIALAADEVRRAKGSGILLVNPVVPRLA
jgi:hypothetical protein